MVLRLKCYIESFYTGNMLKQSKIKVLSDPCEESKILSCASSKMKKIVASSGRSRFSGK